MKKASIIAKLGAAAMAAVMACSSIAASAATVPNATIDTTRKTSLELYKYDFTAAHEDGVLNTDSYVSTGLPDDAVETALAEYAIQGVVFTYAKVADVTTYSAPEADGYKDMVLYEMPDNAKTTQFLTALGLDASDAYRTDGGNLYFVSDVLIDGLSGQLTTIESQTKNALEKFVRDNGGTDMTETDANGHSSKTGMDQGLYILVETYVPENVKDTTSPFLVSLPMTTIDGDDWNYDVTVYPKNETGMPTLEKTLREDKDDTGKHGGTTDDITDGYDHTGTGSDGDIVDYQIISTLPTITSNATALTTYTYVDTLSKGIEYNKQDVQIEWFKDKTCTPENLITTWTEADNKFAVTYGTAANNATTMTIEMTATGLNEINNSDAVYDLAASLYRGYSDCTMRITYKATVNSSADTVYGDNGNPNDVVLTWKRTNTEYFDTLEDDCHFYVYGLDLLKQFSDGKGDFANVQFKLYNNTDQYWVTAELNETEGIYYVKDQAADEADATTFIPVSTGKIIVRGLEDDEYIITEIATDDGYTLLKDSITVVITSAESGVICDVCGKSGITATATVNGDAVGMIEDNGSVSAIVPMSVINTRGFDLPQTGENGTWMFAVGGVLIVSLSAAVIFFILAKKRKADEQ
jgi:fimbrial isopeptide formation D2 family protein/LPXTG-motif cell wall-anchored protein